MRKKINQPFSVSYTISFKGRTKSNGVKTITAEMIKDKMLNVLVDYLHEGHLEEWTVSAQLNHIKKV